MGGVQQLFRIAPIVQNIHDLFQVYIRSIVSGCIDICLSAALYSLFLVPFRHYARMKLIYIMDYAYLYRLFLGIKSFVVITSIYSQWMH